MTKCCTDALVITILLGLSACPPPREGSSSTPLPDDTDALMRWVWSNYSSASEADVHAAVDKLHVAFEGGTRTETLFGTLNDLQAEELRTVGMQDRDPSTTTGLLIVSVMDCTLLHMEKITLYDRQDELYPGVYESYVRTYLDSVDAYRARSTPAVAWTIESSGSLLGTRYTMKYGGGDRYVAPSTGGTIAGPILLNRSWLREPAMFEDEGKSIDQDYQIEISYEREPGKLVHIWADWRQTRVGQFSNNDPTVLDLVLGNMQSWDDQTARLCRENRP